MEYSFIKKSDEKDKTNNTCNKNRTQINFFYIIGILLISYAIIKYRLKLYDIHDNNYVTIKQTNIYIGITLTIIALLIYIKKFKTLSVCEKVVQLIFAICCSHLYIIYTSITYIYKNNI